MYWIPAVRSSSSQTTTDHQPCFLRCVGDNTLLMERVMPASLAFQLNGLNRYNREYRELVKSGGLAHNDSLLATLPADAPVHEEMKLAEIDAQYVKADSLAMHYQMRSDLLFRLFGVMTFTMGLAYLIYEKLTESRILLIAYVSILLGSLGLYYVLRGKHWFAKHLTYRALAETMGQNSICGWRASIIASMPPRCWGSRVSIGFTASDGSVSCWRAWRCRMCGPRRFTTWICGGRAAWRSTGSRASTVISPEKFARLERSSHRVKLLRNTLFIVIVLVIMTLFLFGEKMGGDEQHPGISFRNLLTFSMGFLAVLLGVWELHQDKMATRELLWQYRNQLVHFARARLELMRFATPSRRHEVLVGLGKDSLMECYLWTIHRYHREHEPPAPAVDRSPTPFPVTQV